MSHRFRIALLPGLDGTGELLKGFLDALPPDVDATVVSYPTNHFMDFVELVEHANLQLSKYMPDVILAESFSGPIAFQLVAGPLRHTKLLILCASFLTNPRPISLRLARFLPLGLVLKLPIPEFPLRWLCFDQPTAAETISLFRTAISRVPNSVLAARLCALGKLKPPTSICDTQTVLLRPRCDKLIPKDHTELTRSYFRNVEIIDIDGPHFLLQSRPIEAAREICLTVDGYLFAR